MVGNNAEGITETCSNNRSTNLSYFIGNIRLLRTWE